MTDKGLLLILLGGLLGSSSGGYGQGVVYFEVTGLFNADVILNRQGDSVDRTQSPIDTSAFAQSNSVFLTQGAASLFSDSSPDGLPDDGFFPATPFHPEIQLAYRDEDSGVNARSVREPASFTIDVPNTRYEEIHLFATTGQGSSSFRVRLDYDDGNVVSDTQQVPDWFEDPAETPERYQLIDGRDRIGVDGAGFQDVNSAAIFGYRFELDPTRTLKSFVIAVTEVPGGDINGIPFTGAFNFFGASGVLLPEPSTATLVGMLAIAFAARRGRGDV